MRQLATQMQSNPPLFRGIPKGGRREESPASIRLCESTMARPYSTDLRERVVEAVNEGATRLEAAERFGVSVSSAVRWHQAWRETGTFEAKLCGGSCSPLDDYADEILALVEEQDDRSLDEIVAAMRKRRIPGSRTALFRFLERQGITHKKSVARFRAGARGRSPRPPALDTRPRAA